MKKETIQNYSTNHYLKQLKTIVIIHEISWKLMKNKIEE